MSKPKKPDEKHAATTVPPVVPPAPAEPGPDTAATPPEPGAETTATVAGTDAAADLAQRPTDGPAVVGAGRIRARRHLVFDENGQNLVAAVRNMLAGREPTRAEDRADLLADLEEYIGGELARIEKPHQLFMKANPTYCDDREPAAIIAEFDSELAKFRAVAHNESLPGAGFVRGLPGPLEHLISELAIALLIALVESVKRWLAKQPA